MNLFFDLDGTLIDPKDGITRSINYALDKSGVSTHAESDLLQFIGPPLDDTFRILLKTQDTAVLGQAVTWYRERYVAEGYLENYVYKDIKKLLSALTESEHKLYIVTSKRQDIAQQVLDHFGLAPFFSTVYGCDIHSSKAEMIRYILHERSLLPSECVMIGDRKFDIEAGRANSISTVGVLWGYGTQEELDTAAAEYLASTPSELLDIIRSLSSMTCCARVSDPAI